jgi:uroporphyrinogen-III decarboxylase
VCQTDDWRWGNHIPLFDDYISPRAIKYIISGSEDLSALRYLLCAPSAREIATLKSESEDVINFARRYDLPLVGGWGVGADMLGWIYGFEQMVFAALDQPTFLHEILRIIADWNQARMRVLLEMGIDLYIKRTWYETCNFWSPKTFEKFIAPILKEDIDICHAAGVKFGCIATDKTMPLLKYYPQLGVDVLIGIDPHTYDLQKTKEILKSKVCLWGGVNGHLTVEMGSEKQTRDETRNALEVLGADGGFILSPVDNVRDDTQLSRKNVEALIDEWKKHYPNA